MSFRDPKKDHNLVLGTHVLGFAMLSYCMVVQACIEGLYMHVQNSRFVFAICFVFCRTINVVMVQYTVWGGSAIGGPG